MPGTFFVRLSIDLTGSGLEPAWRSVSVDVEAEENVSTDRIVEQAATHYGVGTHQVSVEAVSHRRLDREFPHGR